MSESATNSAHKIPARILHVAQQHGFSAEDISTDEEHGSSFYKASIQLKPSHLFHDPHRSTERQGPFYAHALFRMEGKEEVVTDMAITTSRVHDTSYGFHRCAYLKTHAFPDRVSVGYFSYNEGDSPLMKSIRKIYGYFHHLEHRVKQIAFLHSFTQDDIPVKNLSEGVTVVLKEIASLKKALRTADTLNRGEKTFVSNAIDTYGATACGYHISENGKLDVGRGVCLNIPMAVLYAGYDSILSTMAKVVRSHRQTGASLERGSPTTGAPHPLR